MEKKNIGMAGEYAVASELCRLGLYTQFTIGNEKRMDLIVLNNDKDKVLKIEVKSNLNTKTGWGNIKGICGKNSFMVFVDFYDKKHGERPDYYILSEQDWIDFLKISFADSISNGDMIVKPENVPFWPKQPFEGCNVDRKNILEHKEAWDKIVDFIK